MSITLSALQKQRRDTAANWTSANPTLLAGEIGIESDTGYWKVGDGSTVWNSLAYLSGLGGEIPVSRLADGSARQLLQTAANGNDVEWTSNVDIPGTLDVTGAATFDSAVTITGNLTVNGTTTNINTQNLVVEDKNIIVGDVATPTDITADGGGITLKGTTDKTINWVDATDAWTLSEHVNIATGKEYRINGTSVLSSTTLGSGVTGSSLTSVGTLATGTWSASTIAVNKGGTGQTSYTDGQLLIGNTTGNTLTQATLTAGSNISITNGNGSITIAGTGGTVTSVSGTAPISVATGTTTPAISIASASTSVVGAVQLTDSTSSTSTTTAATPNSVKTAYDLANAALPKAGGTMTGALGITAGTAAAPSLYFTGDTNSGLFSAGADQVAITTGGSGRLFIDSSGRCGIGVSGPAYTLDVAGSTSAARIGKLNILDDSPFVTGANLVANSNFAVGTQNASSLSLFTNNNARLTITSAGSVGIGTASPTANLHVASTGDATQYLASGTSTSTARLYFLNNTANSSIGCTTAGNELAFYTGPTERFRIGSAGQLGIGGATYGTSGQVLTSGGASAAPTWSAAPSPAALTTASGSAPSYSARAWVNWNGTGTVAIRGSGNVSSITDNGTGDYTVNFTTAMPDANYCVLGTCEGQSTMGTSTYGMYISQHYSTNPTTSAVRVATMQDNNTFADSRFAHIAIFR
jgi:hypothetical protein